MSLKVSVIIPTVNAEKEIQKILSIIPHDDYEVIIIDSSSDDGTVQVAESMGAKVITISRADFNHGGTRNIAFSQANGDYCIFLTQDALPVSKQSLIDIVNAIHNNDDVGMAYGRQIPYDDTNIYGKFARLHNYPAASQMKSMSDVPILGIKTVFVSNSFAVYRKSALERVGGFPTNTILSEDTFVAARMLKLGYKIAYVAEAAVYHSHSYTIMQEFRRYFDIGVFYAREKWIHNEFSSAEGEGLKYLKSEFLYLMRNHKSYLIPGSILRNIMKYTAYRLGLLEKYIPRKIKEKLSMHKGFWRQN